MTTMTFPTLGEAILDHGFTSEQANRMVDLLKVRSRTLVDLFRAVSRIVHDPGERCACVLRAVEHTRSMRIPMAVGLAQERA